MEPSWVEERLGASRMRLVDMREAGVYAEAHVPGAVQLDLARLGRTRGGLDNVILPPGDFAELMESLGVGTGDTVIVYDDQWGLAAARLVWALHFYGHSAAAVLDGGWDRWTDEGRTVTDQAPEAVRTSFEAIPSRDVSADQEWISERPPGDGHKILDTRTQTEFELGHLPEAVLWDWFNAVPPGSWNCARDVDELRLEWEALGVTPSSEVVVYCRSGMRASHTYIVLRHAGFPRVRLYDGSWQEWSMRV